MKTILATGVLMLFLAGMGSTRGKETQATPAWAACIRIAEEAAEEDLIKLIRPVSLGDASKAALASVQGDPAKMKVREVELEAVNGYLVYAVEVVDTEAHVTHKIVVDVSNGTVLESVAESHRWQGSLIATWSVPLAEAEKTALDAVPGNPAKKRAIDAEVEVVGGYIVFEVAVVVAGEQGEYMALVDAGNGRLLSVERTLEDD